MADRIEHAAEARKHIDWAHEQQEAEGDMGNVPRDNALIAVAEATLALVEQQRIANLIALADHAHERWGNLSGEAGGLGTLFSYGETPESNMRLRDDIREGLGL